MDLKEYSSINFLVIVATIVLTFASRNGRSSTSLHFGAEYEKSMIIRATPMTSPTMRPQKAPVSFILFQKTDMQNIIAIGGER